ncbi:MAG: N-acetyl-gamma-glutamyl-phosphate reductase [Proteobacteria bacterium]|nr:N-acetyl-gamma-glutamyl-phosphate reductase [Pseudomonadota bacterium]
MNSVEVEQNYRVGLIGARGHVGSELIPLVAGHPRLELAFISSRTLAGTRLAGHDLEFQDLSPGQVAEREADVYVLALPNGLAAEYVAALDASPHRQAVIVDVSADYRFDDSWVYGQPERFRDRIHRARRIANPGCYATAAQLAIWPIAEQLVHSPQIFGVSGYSGAGTKPSPRNDAENLRDNLIPYSLTGHLHQREISHHLDRAVFFTPHVAPFFRGITLTVSALIAEPTDSAALEAEYRRCYDSESLVRVVGSEIPLVRSIQGAHHVELGGFSVDPTDPRHVVIVATMDNLLKGAATQAVQNINLALELDEFAGIPVAEGGSEKS